MTCLKSFTEFAANPRLKTTLPENECLFLYAIFCKTYGPLLVKGEVRVFFTLLTFFWECLALFEISKNVYSDNFFKKKKQLYLKYSVFRSHREWFYQWYINWYFRPLDINDINKHFRNGQCYINHKLNLLYKCLYFLDLLGPASVWEAIIWFQNPNNIDHTSVIPTISQK